MLRRSPSGSVMPPGSEFGVTGRASRITPSPRSDADPESSNNPADVPGRSDFRLRPQYQYIAVYNAVSEVYRQMYDEALRNDPSNALKMLRNGLIREQLEKRFDAGRSLDWHVDCENPDDPVQVRYTEKYTKLIELIPRFDDYRYDLKWSRWYGKAGLQQFWGNVKVNGKNAISVTNHIPVNGDSIGFTFDGVPKVNISSMADFPKTSVPPQIIQDDRGMALLLNSRYWRTCFAISQYKPVAPDWLREPEMALSMFGYGLRGCMYWTWWLKEEVQRWHIDALERIGSNGDYMGFFPSGNDAAEQAMLKALKLMQRQHYTAIPFAPGQDPKNAIEAVPPANVAYEVQSAFIEYSESIMKRMICGEDNNDRATEASNEQSETAFGTILKCDAKSEADTLTTDLLHPMIRMNDGSLPFQLKISIRSIAKDVGEQIATRQVLFGMGVEQSKYELRRLVGASPPRSEADTIRMPQPPPGGDQAPHDGYGGLPGDSKPAPGPGLAAKGPGLDGLMNGDQPRPDTDQSPGNLPVGLEANLSRKMRAAVQNGNALRNARNDMGTIHAPVGGTDVKGKHFTGGEFTPGQGAKSGTKSGTKKTSVKTNNSKTAHEIGSTGGIGSHVVATHHKIEGEKLTKDRDRFADHVEQHVAKIMNGKWNTGNEPGDVDIPKETGGSHKIEVKSKSYGAKQELSVHAGALYAKAHDAADHPEHTWHTVTIDSRHSSEDGAYRDSYSGHDLYYKRAAGRYKLEDMHKVKDVAELHKLMNTPDYLLPKAAQGEFPKGKALKELKEKADKDREYNNARSKARKAWLGAAAYG